MLSAQEPGIVRYVESAILEQSTDFRIIAHCGECAGVRIAVLAAARSTMERSKIGIVVRDAAVTARDNESAKVTGQTDRAQAVLDHIGLFLAGETKRARVPFRCRRSCPPICESRPKNESATNFPLD